MDEEHKTVKEIIAEKYKSVNNFLDTKKKEYGGELPLTREHLYRLINHETANPGIKSLTILADLVGIPREQVYKEYSE